MPLITRIFLKSGIVFFIASLITGVALQIDSLALPPLMPLFWHMLMLGWITQIIMGVSMWMFPGRVREESFKNQKWAWIAYVSLNIGLWLRVLAEPAVNSSDALIWKILLLTSAILQLIAVISYALEIWPRVRGKKERVSKKKVQSEES